MTHHEPRRPATWQKANHLQVDALNKVPAAEVLVHLRKDDPPPAPIIISEGNQKVIDIFMNATYPDKVRVKRISEDALKTLRYYMAHMLRTLEHTPIESDVIRLQNFLFSDFEVNQNPVSKPEG